jgi:2-polyprenyl-6-methoxyphenol hydroxylase-like FAD-dependent oxidoreductase
MIYLTQATDTFAADVLIVGGGPVGLGLAIELGQRGVRCILSERYQQPQPIPKGPNLTQRTMEHLHFWGAEVHLASMHGSGISQTPCSHSALSMTCPG